VRPVKKLQGTPQTQNLETELVQQPMAKGLIIPMAGFQETMPNLG